MKIKKGDNIIVISGKDKGKTGKISRSFPRKYMVIIDGVNIAKRHQKPRRQNQQGQIIDKPMPIHVSNVMLIDPKTNKPTRIGHRTVGGKKMRVAKKSNTELT